MEIPALIYFSCWSLISITFLGLGFKALNQEKSEISPLVIVLIKRLLAIYVCHSSTYALIHRHGSNSSISTHLKMSIFGFSLPLFVYIMSGPIPLTLIMFYTFLVIATLFLFQNELDFGLCVDFLVRAIILSLQVQKDRFFPVFVLVSAFFTAGIAQILNGPIYDQNGPSGPGPEKKISKKRKFVELGAAILAGLIFQFLVKFTSFNDLLAFLCFAVAWLGCLAMIMPRSDFGTFDLLVGNILVGCVIQFDLFGPTWFAYFVSVVLFVLHSKVKTVKLVHDHDTILW